MDKKALVHSLRDTLVFFAIAIGIVASIFLLKTVVTAYGEIGAVLSLLVCSFGILWHQFYRQYKQ